MKKNIFAILLLSLGVCASAQTEYDALRLSQNDLTGTARYMGVGGAMGALGGDASATKDNPAGLGVYRKSELTGTLNVAISHTAPIHWLDKTTLQDPNSKFSFNNLSYVVATSSYNETGLLGSNFSFSYQKLNDYNKSFAVDGNASSVSFTDFLANFSSPEKPIPGKVSYDNNDMPWLTVLGYDGYLINESGSAFRPVLKPGELVTPAYFINQIGSLSEYSFGWGGNFNNNLFLGANFNIRSLDYAMKSTLRENFQQGGKFELDNNLKQSGLGLNAKFGVIYLPTNDLRLGVSFHTPSFTYIAEESSAELYSSMIPESESYPAKTRVNSQAFNLLSPMQVQASAAYLFGKRGFISAEYNFINYQGMRFGANENTVHKLTDINNAMKDVVNNVHVLKAGAEIKVNSNVALRAGYATMTPAIKSNYEAGKLLVGNSVNTNTEYFDQKQNINYITFGAGYRQANWFFDVAYSLKNQQEDFYPYPAKGLSKAVIDNKTHHVVCTLGFRM